MRRDETPIERPQARKPSALLAAGTPKGKGTNLFNEEAIEAIKREFDQWRRDAEAGKGEGEYMKTLYTMLGSKERIPRPLHVTPLDIADMDYLREIGLPGRGPLTTGLHPTGYRGRNFTIRPIVGFGTPEDTNGRIKFLLDEGATGINIVFDLPTIQEYDSDDPYAKGQVGCCGVAIDTVEDMKTLWKDISVKEANISLTSHYPSNSMILMAMYLVMEAVVRTSPDSLPPEAIFKLQVDNIEFLKQNVPKWNYVTYNGYNLAEAGVDEVTEIAVAFSNALQTVEEMVTRGHDPDQFLDRMAFFWVIRNDFFAEISKMRAARRLWYRLTRYGLGCKVQRSWWCRFHVQTSGISLGRDEPFNNIVRSGYHALAASLGGAQSLHVSAYDEAYSIPTEGSHLVSIRTQQILQEETGVTEVVDPMAGSFYVEYLTRVLETDILKEMDEIWDEGGLTKMIESGRLHRRIAEFSYREQRLLDEGKISMVGSNVHRSSDVKPVEVDVFRYPEGAEERQRDKLKAIRKSRDNEAVAERLAKIRDAAERKENLFPYVLEAVRARATEGEIARSFKEAYGLWNARVHL